jgi:hypothetical protein
MPGPTQPTTAAEWRVIRWLFGTLAVLAALYIGYSLISRSRACAEACATSGQGEGELQSYGHGRFNSGIRCVCVKPER